ncbi:MAG: hypothetical protein ABI767_13260 [Rhodanobacter sp.]
MAHALGGRVGYLPAGREIGTQAIDVLASGRADDLALPQNFRACTTHEQSVLEPPAGATILARSARDPHQLLRFGPGAIGMQFHPEFSADIMRAYIKRKHEDMSREGTDPREVSKAVAHKFRSSRPEFRATGWREPANSTAWLLVGTCPA